LILSQKSLLCMYRGILLPDNTLPKNKGSLLKMSLNQSSGGYTFRTAFLHLAYLDIMWTLFCPAACFTVSCVTWQVVHYRWKYLCDCAAYSLTWEVLNHNYGNGKWKILGLGYKYISMIPVTHQKVKQVVQIAFFTTVQNSQQRQNINCCSSDRRSVTQKQTCNAKNKIWILSFLGCFAWKDQLLY
jgi:hypothetical protein